MIKIEITQTIIERYTEIENFLVHSVPTEIKTVKHGYGNESTEEVQFDRTMEPREVTKTRERRVTLLQQEIVDEAMFSLPHVIASINHLEVA
jgi:hypothetical protein